MSEAKQTMADKQYLAKILFTREKLDQKVVAKRVGISEKTMSKWVNEFNWKQLRDRLLVGKEELLNNMYEELSELSSAIKKKKEGERYGDSKQTDSYVKYTAAIRNLETDLAIADLIASGIKFIKYLQESGTTEQAIEVAELWNSFILSSPSIARK